MVLKAHQDAEDEFLALKKKASIERRKTIKMTNQKQDNSSQEDVKETKKNEEEE